MGKTIEIEGNKFSLEEAKEFMLNYLGERGITDLKPTEIGYLMPQWEANELKKEGLLVKISKEEAKDKLNNLATDNPLIAAIMKLHNNFEDDADEFFMNKQDRAVYTFPKGDLCAFAGYKLLYFK